MSVFEYARREAMLRTFRVKVIGGPPAVRIRAMTPSEAAERVAAIFGAGAVTVELVKEA